MVARSHSRAKLEDLKTRQGLLPEGHGHNPALTVLRVPYLTLFHQID